MSSDGSARTPDDNLDRLMRGALPGDFSFFGRQKEQQPPPLTGIEPGRIIDDFKLIAPIGQGGMGQVWEAEQVSLNRRVALKLVRPDRVNEHTLDLFSREARAGGRLHHSGIVTVYGHGESEGVAWISMELVEGAWTLKNFI
ncbi:MAG: protein kinase, partial [Longimicrobiales bacterium]